jgi:hypothetical protein
MQQVQMTDQLYRETELRAKAAGFSSVDAYIADVLSVDLIEDGQGTPNLDHLFTAERLARIDEAAAQVRGGHFYTTEQADAELAKRRAEWLKNKSA